MLGPVSSQVQHDTVRTGWFTYLADQAARTANGDLAVARASSPGRDGVICRTTLRTPFPPARGRGVAPSEWTVDHGASASSSSVADTLGVVPWRRGTPGLSMLTTGAWTLVRALARDLSGYGRDAGIAVKRRG